MVSVRFLSIECRLMHMSVMVITHASLSHWSCVKLGNIMSTCTKGSRWLWIIHPCIHGGIPFPVWVTHARMRVSSAAAQRVVRRSSARRSDVLFCWVRRSSLLVDPARIFSDVIDHVPIALLPLATHTHRQTDREANRHRRSQREDKRVKHEEYACVRRSKEAIDEAK